MGRPERDPTDLHRATFRPGAPRARGVVDRGGVPGWSRPRPPPRIDGPLRTFTSAADHSKLWIGAAAVLFVGGGPQGAARGPHRRRSDRVHLDDREPADEARRDSAGVRTRTRPASRPRAWSRCRRRRRSRRGTRPRPRLSRPLGSPQVVPALGLPLGVGRRRRRVLEGALGGSLPGGRRRGVGGRGVGRGARGVGRPVRSPPAGGARKAGASVEVGDLASVVAGRAWPGPVRPPRSGRGSPSGAGGTRTDRQQQVDGMNSGPHAQYWRTCQRSCASSAPSTGTDDTTTKPTVIALRFRRGISP